MEGISYHMIGSGTSAARFEPAVYICRSAESSRFLSHQHTWQQTTSESRGLKTSPIISISNLKMLKHAMRLENSLPDAPHCPRHSLPNRSASAPVSTQSERQISTPPPTPNLAVLALLFAWILRSCSWRARKALHPALSLIYFWPMLVRCLDPDDFTPGDEVTRPPGAFCSFLSLPKA